MATSDNFRSRTRAWPAPALTASAFFVLTATPALAAEGHKGPSEAIFLAALVVLMVAGRLMGEAMQRIGQPAVMGQLLAGLLLGPSVFGALWPDAQHALFPSSPEQKSMVDAISQFGILLLLLLTGMETDLKLVRKVGHAAISVSLTGVAVPFACGVALGELLPDSLLPDGGQRLVTSLFLGTALSISSIKIVAAIVREMNFTRRDLGQVIVSSAIVEDTIGWIIIAITFSLAQSGGIDLASVAKSVIGTAVFLGVSLTVGRRAVALAIRWANDHLASEFAVITTILVIMGVMALITHAIGVHTVLGAFVAGVLIGESPLLTRHIDEQLRGMIMAFFMPVFFGLAGLSADLTILADRTLLMLALGLITIASLGKFAGAFLGGKIGGLNFREALALGCGMNARGSTEVIVATIGLSMGALSQNLFTMIVAMAITTTMAMPPMLRWALSRVPLRKAEKERLEREEMEAKGFVPQLERLLLAVDHSPNGQFASRLGGLLAGNRGIPITVLPLSAKAVGGKAGPTNGKGETETAVARKGEETSKEAVETAAEDTKKKQPKDDKPDSVDVTVRIPDAPTPEAVAREAEKGYDVLFIGIAGMRVKDGGYSRAVDGIAGAFEGALALVDAKGEHCKDPEQSELNILVPVNGTDVSRRAAEVAIEMARGARAPVTALYVSGSKSTQRGGGRGGARTRRHERAILDEISELAGKYQQEIETAIRADVAPDRAVVAEAKKNGHTLIVMGVSRRPGDRLYFGETAAGIIKDAPISVMFVAS
jgi:Kef-type K+ transport system membrane component KefB/nucleotide-binding universal stress UspA family protein